MKKITLALLVASALFGQTEEYYKDKYQLLIKELNLYRSECSNAINTLHFIRSSGKLYTRAETDIYSEDERIKCNNFDDIGDQIMALHSKVIEDLKVKPEWFTFGDKQ